jgi:lipopolysaccharide transport system ATP-binding protein
MNDIAIRCEGLGKQYRIGERERYRALRDTITSAMSAPFRRIRSAFNNSVSEQQNGHNTFWALKDVSFEIKRGEVVGVIGRNGAGKSTLLKILSRITAPTAGEVEITGRVGSLLEVGTGFHPELTGRENIYLNGAILGMRKAEIERKFDEIVSFAEIKKFIDTPVKRYSSGMYVRLAFAVAANLNSEILVVDEVLAVGDVQFQKKCLGKMDEVAQSGRTIFFVSHNMGAIKALCRTALWLDYGHIKAFNTCQNVVGQYLGAADDNTKNGNIVPQQHIRGTGDTRIKKVSLRDKENNVQNAFLVGEAFQILLEYIAVRPIDGTFWLLVSSADGTVIFSSFQKDVSESIPLHFDGKTSVALDGLSFLPGLYFISVGVFSKASEIVDWVDSAIRFEILPHFKNGQAFDHRYGLITKELSWQVEQKHEYQTNN